ncbi:MAG TPA: Spy/CpxP family protein refolding chaperone [Thermodesulfobacteriota bacterium]|jgi:Spy/CpxP family protein refolding chaperone|nr:Spy/CpxP family protein refolding chaperone [Thermodesulfobacteriota bacterium]
MRKTIVALGLVAIMLLGVTYANAQGPGMGPGYGPGYRGMHEHWGPGRESSLTPEQKAKIQELRQKFSGENAKLTGAIVTKRLELRTLWTDPKADSKAILDKEKELRDLQNQMRDKVVQMKLEARKFLTPEQIENWGPGFGMGRGFEGGYGMGRGMGPGHGRMGRGGMGPGYGCY